MRLAPASLLLLLAAGCGDDPPAKGTAQTSNMVRQDPTRQPSARDIPAPRLEPLGHDDVERAGLAGAGCDFSVGEQLLLVAVQDDAIVRVGETVLHLARQGPLGGTGGFFASSRLRVRVGRTSHGATAAGEGSSWPATISVTNPVGGAPQQIQGRWACGS